MTEEEKYKKVQEASLFEDAFFEVAAEDPAVCEEIIQTILENDKIHVLSVTVQKSERIIGGRSIRIDALCEFEDGSKCNIEVQQANNLNHIKRTRYHSSVITVKESDPGDEFDDIVTLYVIYISRKDFMKGGKTIYHVENVVRETGEVVDDGLHRIFVNAEINDNTKISELMDCFKQPMFNNSNFPALSRKVKQIKVDEGGRKVMTLSEEFYTEGMQEGKIEEKLRVYELCLKKGMTKAEALEISELPEDKIPAEE